MKRNAIERGLRKQGRRDRAMKTTKTSKAISANVLEDLNSTRVAMVALITSDKRPAGLTERALVGGEAGARYAKTLLKEMCASTIWTRIYVDDPRLLTSDPRVLPMWA